jgi:undecaprenyl-diphosphatase
VAFIPAMVMGFLLNDFIDAMLEKVDVVAYSLIAGGIIFLFIDRLFAANEQKDTDSPTMTGAFKIGLFQTIAMIPGVSRSAATIIGGLSHGLNKRAAAEFSFFLAVPTMFGATAYKIYSFYKSGETFGSHEVTLLLIGNVVAFIVAIIAIRSFISFLTRHGFKIFGYYRIVLGVIILTLYFLGVDLAIV